MSEIGQSPVVVHEAAAIPPEVAEAAATAATANAEAAVAIAEVQAAANVEQTRIVAEEETAREEIRADAAVEAAEAIAPAVSMEEELSQCRKNLETISTNQASILQRLTELEGRQNPPPAPSTDGTQTDGGSRRTEPPGHRPEAGNQTPVAGQQNQPPEPPKKKSAVRWT